MISPQDCVPLRPCFHLVVCATAVALLALACGWSLRAETPATSSALQVGTGAAEFTANDEMTIAGGIGGAKVHGQEGQLRAVAVVLEHPVGGKFAIVACDVLFVTDAMVQAAAAEIERRCFISPDHLLVNATHTHSAPSTIRVHGYGPEPEFIKSVIDGIIRAVELADERRTEHCRFAYRLGEENTIAPTAGCCSRTIRSTGSVRATTRCGRRVLSIRNCRCLPFTMRRISCAA